MDGRTFAGLAVRTSMVFITFFQIALPDQEARSQQSVPATVRIDWLPDSLSSLRQKTRFGVSQNLDYSLAASLELLLNWKQGEPGDRLDLLQHLRYQVTVTNERSFRLFNQLDHHLGFRYCFDSVSGIREDDNTLDTRLDWNLTPLVALSLNSSLNTRLLKGFDWQTDSTGATVRVMNSSFLTPLVWSFSLGISRIFRKAGILTLEFSSARLTYLRDRSVFGIRKVHEFFGVPEGKSCNFEYGLGLRLLIATRIFARIDWNSDIRVFKDWKCPIDLTVNNEFAMRLWKYLKIAMRTRIFYEKEVSKHLQLENLVSFGFYISV